MTSRRAEWRSESPWRTKSHPQWRTRDNPTRGQSGTRRWTRPIAEARAGSTRRACCWGIGGRARQPGRPPPSRRKAQRDRAARRTDAAESLRVNRGIRAHPPPPAAGEDPPFPRRRRARRSPSRSADVRRLRRSAPRRGQTTARAAESRHPRRFAAPFLRGWRGRQSPRRRAARSSRT